MSNGLKKKLYKAKKGKPYCTNKLAYLSTLLYILCAAGGAATVYGYAVRNWYICFGGLGTMLVLALICKIISSKYEWEPDREMKEFSSDMWIYSYMSPISFMGNNRCQWQIRSITSLEERGNKLKITGDITKREEIGKSKGVKFLVIRTDFEDYESMKEDLEKFKEKTKGTEE